MSFPKSAFALLLTILSCHHHHVTCATDGSGTGGGHASVVWNPSALKIRQEVSELEVAGITINTATCEEKACTEKGYGIAYQPDLFVYIDYGEFDDLGLGSRHRVGFFGKTSQVKKANTADYGRATFKYNRSQKTHNYKVRSNGYYDIQLYDGDTSLYKPNFLGYTVVNVTDFGPGERLLSGMQAAYVAFEIFGAIKRDS